MHQLPRKKNLFSQVSLHRLAEKKAWVQAENFHIDAESLGIEPLDFPPITKKKYLGQEDPLEEEMATHSNSLAWEIPWTEEPGGHSLWGHKEPDTTEQLTHKTQKITRHPQP